MYESTNPLFGPMDFVTTLERKDEEWTASTDINGIVVQATGESEQDATLALEEKFAELALRGEINLG